MLAWIANNAVTIIATAAVLAVIGIAVFALVREKKRGAGKCTGNCASCGMCCAYGKKNK